MKPLWEHLELIKTKVIQSEKLLLLLDYDGTLAPIADRPEEAPLPLRAKAALRQLLPIPRYRVGIVSGRSADDVAGMVGIEGIIYAGNHGLELLYPEGRWVHPDVARLRPKLVDITKGLARELGHIPGLRIQDKGATLSVHYRLVAGDPQQEIRRRVQRVLHPFADYFEVTEGKKVLEVRPTLSCHKGTAICSIAHLLKAGEGDLTIYMGDDETDEDAFAALKPGDIGIRVGKSDSSAATYFVRDTEEVHALLETVGLWLS